MQKKINYILLGKEKKITDQQRVLQPLPHKDFRFANPFIVLHHLVPSEIEPGSTLRIHPHPHRGFAPVTFQLQGQGHHKDNAGHEALIEPGDVQSMFAGSGVLHSEGPSANQLKNGGTYELIQLWINVPAAYKYTSPTYQQVMKSDQPKVLEQPGTDLRIVCGEYDGIVGPLKTFTPIVSIVGELQKCSRIQLTANPGYWTMLYISKGSIQLNCEHIGAYNLIVFEKSNEEVIFSALEDAQILYLSGLPIDEPLAVRDNFVMNTREEIEKAMDDANNNKFGELRF